jgi:hypothetical protein
LDERTMEARDERNGLISVLMHGAVNCDRYAPDSGVYSGRHRYRRLSWLRTYTG